MKHRIFAAVLCLSLLFTFVGCKNDDDSGDKKEETPDVPTAVVSQIKELDDEGYYSVETFTYDETGRILKDVTASYSPTGSFINAYGDEYVYDDGSKTFTQYFYFYDTEDAQTPNEPQEYRVNLLDGNGRVFKDELYRKNDAGAWFVDIVCEYAYDAEGRTVSDKIKYVTDRTQPIDRLEYYVAYETIYVYENGRLTSETEYAVKDGRQNRTVNREVSSYNADGTLKEVLYYYGDESLIELYERYEYVYENGNLTTYLSYYCHGDKNELDGKEIYVYNAANRLTQKTVYEYGDGQENGRDRYDYLFDAYGNVTKESRYLYDYEQSDYRFYSSIETTYTYVR